MHHIITSKQVTTDLANLILCDLPTLSRWRHPYEFLAFYAEFNGMVSSFG